MRVLVAAQQAVLRWRREKSGSFDRILTEVEQDWWHGAPEAMAERRAYRLVAALLKERTDNVRADPEPGLELVRQVLAAMGDGP
jgi:hypothetical protein